MGSSVSLFTAGLAAAAITQLAPAAAAELQEVTVTATRATAAIDTVPQSITVITPAQLEEQAALSSSLGDMLGKLVPGLSVGRESISSFGQNLRGRPLQILIDGVPQSTNRNGSRLFNIDVSAIERIEVIRGATAIYGDGATGGIINIITHKAPADGEPRVRTSIGAEVSLTHPGDSLGGQLRQLMADKNGAFDYVFNAALEKVGGLFDAEGDRMPPYGQNQGGLSDTLSYDLLGKLGWDIGPQQRLELAATVFRSEQDTDDTSDPALAATFPQSEKAHTISGLRLDENVRTRNDQYTLDYRHQDILGSKLHALVFYRSYYAVFAPADGRSAGSTIPFVYQSYIDSDKHGARLELETPLLERSPLTMVWGVDFTNEETEQPAWLMDATAYTNSGGLQYDRTGESVWVPPYELSNLGGFAQLEWRPLEALTVRGGLRRELISADVDDYVTARSAAIRGGDLDYSDTLYNLGAVYDFGPGLNVFVNYGEGFSMPDLGLILRGAVAGQAVDTIETTPQKVKNYEIGVRSHGERVDASASVYYSKNELGTSSGGFNAPVVRAPERIYGFEATLDAQLTERLRGGGSFTYTEGKSDTAAGWTWLNNSRITPYKVTAYLEHHTSPQWRHRLQATYSGERERFGEAITQAKVNNYTLPVDDYTTVDWYSRLQLGRDTFTFGINNLLNEEYYNTFSQMLNTRSNTSYVQGRGATLHVTYTHEW